MNLGAHVSISGGAWKAFERAAECGCRTMQIFTKNNNQWQAKALTDEECALFEKEWKASQIGYVMAHDSYLINLGSPDPALWTKSLDAFVVEIERCEALGIGDLVMHPGSHMGEGERPGIERIARGIREALARTRGSRSRVLLETTAGQGTNLGNTFEQLAAIRDAAGGSDRLAICADTCHLLAAGHEIRNAEGWAETMDRFDRILGIESLDAFHVNDSKTELGSRVDRHEHIGQGTIGKKGFGPLLGDPRFVSHPMILETPKEDPGDAGNLKMLRKLRGNADRGVQNAE